MDSDDLLLDIILEENTIFKANLFSVKKSRSVVVKQRKLFGEFNILYESLRTDPVKFQEYTRMSVSTFDYRLQKMESRLNYFLKRQLPNAPNATETQTGLTCKLHAPLKTLGPRTRQYIQTGL
jgi:hypothetical protein